MRSSLRRRSLDESERLADAFAEKLLTDGGDIGDDEALAQGVSPQGRGFEPHSSPRSNKTWSRSSGPESEAPAPSLLSATAVLSTSTPSLPLLRRPPSTHFR